MGNVLIIKRIFQAVTMQAKRGSGGRFFFREQGDAGVKQPLELGLSLSPRGSGLRRWRKGLWALVSVDGGGAVGGPGSGPGFVTDLFELKAA